MSVDECFSVTSSSHINREREKAKALKKTRWWRDKLQQGICYHCGKKFEPLLLTMDHLSPLARGGRTGKNNIVPSCQTCNTNKSYKTLVELKLKRSNKM